MNVMVGKNTKFQHIVAPSQEISSMILEHQRTVDYQSPGMDLSFKDAMGIIKGSVTLALPCKPFRKTEEPLSLERESLNVHWLPSWDWTDEKIPYYFSGELKSFTGCYVELDVRGFNRTSKQGITVDGDFTFDWDYDELYDANRYLWTHYRLNMRLIPIVVMEEKVQNKNIFNVSDRVRMAQHHNPLFSSNWWSDLVFMKDSARFSNEMELLNNEMNRWSYNPFFPFFYLYLATLIEAIVPSDLISIVLMNLEPEFKGYLKLELWYRVKKIKLNDDGPGVATEEITYGYDVTPFWFRLDDVISCLRSPGRPVVPLNSLPDLLKTTILYTLRELMNDRFQGETGDGKPKDSDEYNPNFEDPLITTTDRVNMYFYIIHDDHVEKELEKVEKIHRKEHFILLPPGYLMEDGLAPDTPLPYAWFLNRQTRTITRDGEQISLTFDRSDPQKVTSHLTGQIPTFMNRYIDNSLLWNIHHKIKHRQRPKPTFDPSKQYEFTHEPGDFNHVVEALSFMNYIDPRANSGKALNAWLQCIEENDCYEVAMIRPWRLYRPIGNVAGLNGQIYFKTYSRQIYITDFNLWLEEFITEADFRNEFMGSLPMTGEQIMEHLNLSYENPITKIPFLL